MFRARRLNSAIKPSRSSHFSPEIAAFRDEKLLRDRFIQKLSALDEKDATDKIAKFGISNEEFDAITDGKGEPKNLWNSCCLNNNKKRTSQAVMSRDNYILRTLNNFHANC